MNNNLVKVLYRGKIFIFLFIIIYFFIILNIFLKKTKTQQILKENNLQNYNKKVDKIKNHFNFLQKLLKNEAKMPHLNKILKKRIFKIRLPLPKEIKCKSHLTDKELSVFPQYSKIKKNNMKDYSLNCFFIFINQRYNIF